MSLKPLSFTRLGARYIFPLRAMQALLFLCCVTIKSKTYLAPSCVNEWGLNHRRLAKKEQVWYVAYSHCSRLMCDLVVLKRGPAKCQYFITSAVC